LLVGAALAVLACGTDTSRAATEPLIGPTVAVTVSPTALSLVEGETGRLTARSVDVRNRTAVTSAEWSSTNPAVATVSSLEGYVVAVAPGSTMVTATVGSLSASAIVSVRLPDPPVAVSISPTAVSFVVGSVERLVARAVDSTGRTAKVSFAWTSANPAIATVGATDGLVTAIAPGSTTVTVTTGALAASVPVSVIDFSGSFAFTRTSSVAGRFSSDVFIYSADSGLRPLPRSSEFASIAGATWSPNGTQLAVERVGAFYGPPDYEWMEYNSDLYIVDAATSRTSAWRALTTNGMSRSPSWSPDGRRIAYVEQDELFVHNHIALIDVAGGTPVRLTDRYGYYGKPLWSPDGSQLAFSAWVAGSNESQIFVVDADGRRSTMITPAGTSDYDPSWSPDGARLTFIRFRADAASQYRFDVVVANVDGSDVRRIASPPGFSSEPAWSPDGRQIMFASDGGLYVMNADGSALTRITSPTATTYDGTPRWGR
jgi:dipeptidyl aminopeptidase/acylaminoacyl peptidase